MVFVVRVTGVQYPVWCLPTDSELTHKSWDPDLPTPVSSSTPGTRPGKDKRYVPGRGVYPTLGPVSSLHSHPSARHHPSPVLQTQELQFVTSIRESLGVVPGLPLSGGRRTFDTHPVVEGVPPPRTGCSTPF